MSMNIFIRGVREVVTVKEPKIYSKQYHKFDCWQTPTEVSYSITEHESVAERMEAYKAWVKTRGQVRTVEVYAPDDFFQKGEPIGTETVDEAQDHILELDEFIKECESGGYDIEVFVS